jgi:hypothetical protein
MKQKLPIGIKTNPSGFLFMRRDPHTTDEVSEQTTDTLHPQLGGANN